MTPLDVTRKLDSVGRMVIPIELRREFKLTEGVAYRFFLHEENNHKYLCIQCPGPDETEIERAKALLQESGYNVSKG